MNHREILFSHFNLRPMPVSIYPSAFREALNPHIFQALRDFSRTLLAGREIISRRRGTSVSRARCNATELTREN